MGLVNLVLWGAGVALIVIGYTRARGPLARYNALKEQDANVALRGVAGWDPRRRWGHGDRSRCRSCVAGPDRIAVGVVGFVLIFTGFLKSSAR